MSKIINAFHPDFIKTYYPDFMQSFRVESRNKQSGQTLTEFVEKTRKKKPMHGTLSGISKKQISIKPLEFMIFSRAGTKNTTKKKK